MCCVVCASQERERESEKASVCALMEHKEMLLNIFETFIRNVIKFVAQTRTAANFVPFVFLCAV